MSHVEMTDATIEIECAECSAIIVGIEAIRRHILEWHPTYNIEEAKEYARLWADDAYDRYEQQEYDYGADRAYEKSIHHAA